MPTKETKEPEAKQEELWEDAGGEEADAEEDEPGDLAYGTEYSDETPEDAEVRLTLRLMQSLSEEVKSREAEEGQFVVSGVSDPVEKLVLVPIAGGTPRALRDKDTRELLCSSRDGKTGTGDPGGECKKCKLSQWGEKRKPPACSEIYAFMCYWPAEDVIVRFSCSRASAMVGQQIRGFARMRGYKKFAIEMTSIKKARNNDEYYIPKVKLLRTMEGIELPEHIRPAVALPEGEAKVTLKDLK